MADLRERCKAWLNQYQQNMMLRVGNPVDDLASFVQAEVQYERDVCAAIAGRSPGYVSCDETFTRGYNAACENMEKAIIEQKDYVRGWAEDAVKRREMI